MTNYTGQKFGNYLLLKSLGKGGFADVYLGEHLYLHTHAAIKILYTQLSGNDIEAFLREAQVVAHLAHPHIIRVLEFGVEQTTPYLVMDYAAQGTLRTRYPRGEHVPLPAIVSYTNQVAAALQYAHNQKLIHRDVKPENMLLSQENHVLLGDFGIALVLHTSQKERQQKLAGTVAYMAPEQIREHPEPASDQYALAVVVYEWLCGALPFQGTFVEMATKHCLAAPPPLREKLPTLTASIEQVVFKALAKDPRKRFLRVLDFAQALEQACQEIEENKTKLFTPTSSTLSPSPDPTHFSLPPVAPLRPPPASFSQPSHSPVSLQDHQNRQRLLAKVRAFWITGALEHSLHGAALIALGLQELPEAVTAPWHLRLQQSEESAQLLPLGMPIVQVYDQAAGELLILGEPGSGKTTLLLELARDLLDRATKEEAHPLPVVFNLSSWGTAGKQSLAHWLLEELYTKYQVPRALARRWIEAHEILPLLDGLDEVSPPHRKACVEAINTYRQEHGMIPLVVCCRSNEYHLQSSSLLLCNAVVIQPLTPQQIDAYLSEAGGQLLPIRVALRNDLALQELMTTPLMLTILVLAYRGLPLGELLAAGPLAARRQRIFATYIQRMLQHRSRTPSYTPQQITHWLSWLARQMIHNSQAEFYLEHMQPGLLIDQRIQRWYRTIVIGIVVGLAGGITAILADTPISNIATVWLHLMADTLLFEYLLVGVIYGIFFSVLGGLTGWFTTNRAIRSHGRALHAEQRRRGRRLVSSASLGLSFGSLFTLVNLLWVPYPFLNLTAALLARVSFGLVGGLCGCLIGGLVGIEETAIKPVEKVTWRRPPLKRALIFLTFGTGFGILLGLLLSLIAPLYSSNSLSLTFLTEGMVIMGIISAGTGLLLSGLTKEQFNDHTYIKPNQGMRVSARNSIIFGALAGLAFLGGVFVLPIVAVSHGRSDLLQLNLQWVWIYGIPLSLIVTLTTGLINGGYACIQHAVLRLVLWHQGHTPWNYTRFLDYASERLLLHKVGGGYVFVHRLLLEHFASSVPSLAPETP